MGLPDDSDELATLRQFRRNHLKGTPSGDAILFEYEKVSKEILSWIERQPNQEALYRNLFDRLVVKSVELIKDGQFERAINHYRGVVEEYTLAAKRQREGNA